MALYALGILSKSYGSTYFGDLNWRKISSVRSQPREGNKRDKIEHGSKFGIPGSQE